MSGLLPAANEETKCFKKVQGEWITREQQLDHLNDFLKLIQLRLESAPSVLGKVQTISSMTGSMLEAYCLWGDLSTTDEGICCVVFMDALE